MIDKNPSETKEFEPLSLNWGCAIVVCIFSFFVFIGVTNFRAMQLAKNCQLAERNASIICASVASYYSDPEKSGIPSMETLKKEEHLGLSGEGYIFGSSPCTITVITSSAPKRCSRGKYYVVRSLHERWGEWVDEWPAGIDLASAGTDDLTDEDKYRLANEAYLACCLTSKKLLDPEEIYMKLINEQFKNIEEILKDVESQFAENIENEFLFLNSYELFFFDTASNYLELGTYFTRWIEETDSYMAYAARGTYYKNRAYDYRGSGYINSVSKEDLEMARKYWNLAILDFKKSIDLNPNLLPAYSQIVRTMRSLGKLSEAESYVRKILDIYPESYYIRRNYLKFLQPKWGSSFQEAFEFIDQSQEYGDINPRIWSLRGYVYSSIGYNYLVEKNYKCAVENYSNALKYGDNTSWLATTARALWQLKEYEASVRTMEKIRPYASDPERLETTISFLKESLKNENFDTKESPNYDTFEQRW